MFQDKKIRVAPDKVKPGEKYSGYDYVGGTCYCRITIQEDNTPIVYDKWPISEEKEVLYFFRDMTYDEEKEDCTEFLYYCPNCGAEMGGIENG